LEGKAFDDATNIYSKFKINRIIERSKVQNGLETVHLDLPYQSYYFGTFLVQPIFD
jgi:hypothetical protein